MAGPRAMAPGRMCENSTEYSQRQEGRKRVVAPSTRQCASLQRHTSHCTGPYLLRFWPATAAFPPATCDRKQTVWLRRSSHCKRPIQRFNSDLAHHRPSSAVHIFFKSLHCLSNLFFFFFVGFTAYGDGDNRSPHNFRVRLGPTEPFSFLPLRLTCSSLLPRRAMMT